jgi:hypothetical protein
MCRSRHQVVFILPNGSRRLHRFRHPADPPGPVSVLRRGFRHLPPGHPDSPVDWAALARSANTLELLMAVPNRFSVAQRLLHLGCLNLAWAGSFGRCRLGLVRTGR